MRKRLVIKNTENNKYFTGNYNGFWSLDIDDAQTFNGEESVEKEIKHLTDPESSNDVFEKVKSVVIETVYFLKD